MENYEGMKTNYRAYDKALAGFTEAIRLNPDDTEARNNLEILRGMGY
ncbi:MAG: hypothetical protein LBT00_16085 [Spirochaetaceae bacterium]|jgi:hypothetical protein|nr:hypothetical protein [Spirochaetaceae bacterium]